MAFIKVSDLYFLTVLVLIRLSRSFGWPWLRSQLIRFLGWLAYRFSTNKRLKSQKGLEEAFGSELDERDRERIVRSSFRSFWNDSFTVLPFKQELARLEEAVVYGEESLRLALDRGKGVILLESNSFGDRLVAKQILSKKGFSIHQVHAENHLNGLRNDSVRGSWLRGSVLKTTFEHWEKEFVTEMIYLPEGDSLLFTRTILRRLSGNSIVCSAGDGRMGQKLVSVPFLGRARPFATGMFSLSALSGAPILPLFCFRRRVDQTRLIIGPEIVVTKGKVEEAVVSYVNQLEGYIRKYPEQYRNWQF
jgi:lauroyl/myristoyl acyltransferase